MQARDESTFAVRWRLRVSGRVQGVGFRPFVYRLAAERRLSGMVGNDDRGVFIELQGAREDAQAVVDALRESPPPLARVEAIHQKTLPLAEQKGFRIVESDRTGRREVEVTPDAATCPDCLRELHDPQDRRFSYPFINCTHCGPRYSIVLDVPYDRANTTMASFEMCPDCRREYADPADRRFHAQPDACPVCGPRAWLVDRENRAVEGPLFTRAADLLRQGKILAVKGLGGFHLACLAGSEEAVDLLRRRKGRETKPLAVMAPDLASAHRLVCLSPEAQKALLCPARPIVLAPRQAAAAVAPSVAPGTAELGVFLPYTPLHALLLEAAAEPLVLTSGNPTDEPLCRENVEALGRLKHLADFFLLHDRPIARAVDDSVVLDGPRGPVPLRRARGYVPAPIALPVLAQQEILAVGGELKSAPCYCLGAQAMLTEHLGDLHNPKAYRNFVATLELFERLLQIRPAVIAHDLHPGYGATRYARDRARREDLSLIAVQHHHAHAAACLAENGVWDEPALAMVCDGTGYGTDGAIWGCEILFCRDGDFQREGHLCYYPLAGGDAAARETWRPALGLLVEALGAGWREKAGDVLNLVPPEGLDLVAARLEQWREAREAGRSLAWVPAQSSSLGRLFDGVAFLLGLEIHNAHEAQAAMRLESEARLCTQEPQPLTLSLGRGDSGEALLDFAPLVLGVLERRKAGEAARSLARAFHLGLVESFAEALREKAREKHVQAVALSGGCFANGLLLEGLTRRLEKAGLRVLLHHETPVGDGCVALGQAVVAAAQQKGGT